MRLETAYAILNAQDKCIRKVNDRRFVYDGYEYRLMYGGGFAAYVGIDRREVGKRNFKYFSGVSAYDCLTVGQVMDKVMSRIKEKVGR